MKEKISSSLRKLGFRATLHGFYYLSSALLLVLEDESYLLHLTTRLYPEIAKIYSVSAICVERSLRTLLTNFWDRGDVSLLEDMVGYSLTVKPYLGEFIDILADYLRHPKSVA